MKKFLWWRDGVIYQIYPRSFMDTNGDGIGDLEGIISQLDYLKDLGVDALWLSPVYPSPDVDFGYDVSDYCAIDPKFGTMRDFDRLLVQAHKRDIHIIMDLVLNHTSDQHPWFQESRKSRVNKFRDYYIWKDPQPDGTSPNNWLSIFGGTGWEFDDQSGQYYFHHFFKEQPDLNWRNPAVRKEMLDIFRFWLEKGVDGFRLDVFSAYFKDAEFRDDPKKLVGLRKYDRLVHLYDADRPEMIPLLREIRTLLDGYPERYAVGETFMATFEKAALYCGDDLLHAAFSFDDFINGPWKAQRFRKAIKTWEKVLEGKCWPNYVLNNHDVKRSATRYDSDEKDERSKVAAAMLLTLRGTPFMYYGEEIGMREGEFKKHEILDPIGLYYWPFYKGRDGCRTPMQWDASENAGFSSATPWLPVNPDYLQRNVSEQMRDKGSLFNFYKELLKLRKEHPALMQGDLEMATVVPGNTLIFFRCLPEEQAMIALNFNQGQKRLDLLKNGAADCELVLSSKLKALHTNYSDQYILDGNEAAIFILKNSVIA